MFGWSLIHGLRVMYTYACDESGNNINLPHAKAHKEIKGSTH